MRNHRFCTADVYAAQHKAIAISERVHIVAMSNPDVTHRVPVSCYSK
jgi:hypothetical protein